MSTTISVVGVHVLDTHVMGVESIPSGSDGQLVETIRRGRVVGQVGTGRFLNLSHIGASICSGLGQVGRVGQVSHRTFTGLQGTKLRSLKSRREASLLT